MAVVAMGGRNETELVLRFSVLPEKMSGAREEGKLGSCLAVHPELETLSLLQNEKT